MRIWTVGRGHRRAPAQFPGILEDMAVIEVEVEVVDTSEAPAQGRASAKLEATVPCEKKLPCAAVGRSKKHARTGPRHSSRARSYR